MYRYIYTNNELFNINITNTYTNTNIVQINVNKT